MMLPALALAEYNGVHITFNIEFKNGKELIGYKYIAHHQNSEADKIELESQLEVLLRNDLTYEPGTYSCYLKRLEYSYHETILYQLIEPVEIDLSQIENLRIIDMAERSYAIQISNDHVWEDRHWMDSEPISKYSESEGMCTYDVFLHHVGELPPDIRKELVDIIEVYNLKIQSKEKAIARTVESDEEYSLQMKPIYELRNEALAQYFQKYKHLKTLVISMCTC